MAKPAITAAKPYYVYIARCADQTLYTGIALDVAKRISDHNSTSRGAKYTRPRRPVKLVYVETFADKSEALKAEMTIKKLKRSEKLRLISS